MTKSELLACHDPREIWQAIKDDPLLRRDPEILNHATKLTAVEEAQRVNAFFGDPDAYASGLHIDYAPRKRK